MVPLRHSFLFTLIYILHVSAKDKEFTRMRADGVLSLAHSLSLSIKINEAHDSIEIDLLGPSDAYYAVGFGSNVMVNTWSIVVTGDGDEGWFEQTLSNHKAGISHTAKSFEMLTSTLSAQSFLRSLHLKRSLTSLESYHPFNVDDDSIELIWAVGSDPTFSQHIERGTVSLNYVPDGVDAQKPHIVWIFFGNFDLSALILVIGMGCLFIVLLFYWGWKCCRYLKQRALQRDCSECEEDQPLLHNIDSNNRYIII